MSYEEDFFNADGSPIKLSNEGKKLGRQTNKVIRSPDHERAMNLHPYPDGHPDAQEVLPPVKQTLIQMVAAAAIMGTFLEVGNLIHVGGL